MKNMNIKLDGQMYAWIVVGVILVLGIWYFATGGGSEQTAVSDTSTTTQAAPSTTGGSASTGVKKPAGTAAGGAVKPPVPSAKISGVGSVNGLFLLKEPLVCTIATTNAYVKRTGTLYVSGGRVRGELTGYENGVKVASSMIDDGKYLYAWKQGMAQGLQLLAASSVAGSAIAAAGGLDLEGTFSYSCNPWAEDASLFMPPSSVSFSNSVSN